MDKYSHRMFIIQRILKTGLYLLFRVECAVPGIMWYNVIKETILNSNSSNNYIYKILIIIMSDKKNFRWNPWKSIDPVNFERAIQAATSDMVERGVDLKTISVLEYENEAIKTVNNNSRTPFKSEIYSAALWILGYCLVLSFAAIFFLSLFSIKIPESLPYLMSSIIAIFAVIFGQVR